MRDFVNSDPFVFQRFQRFRATAFTSLQRPLMLDCLLQFITLLPTDIPLHGASRYYHDCIAVNHSSSFHWSNVVFHLTLKMLVTSQ